MATTRRKRRTTSSNSPLEDILGGIAGTTTRRRSRRPTVGGLTGGKASSSIFLTLAAICFAVGYYVQGFDWLIYVGIGLAVIYLIVTYFRNRKKNKADEPVVEKTTKPAEKQAPPLSEEDGERPHLSESQRAQISDRLKTLPELQPLHPRLSDAAKLAVHQRTASTVALTSMLKLNDADAATVIRQLELIGIIGSAQPDGSHSVYVTGDDELSEWLQLLF
ncbi:MAG: hypothetical protein Q4E32_07885 [Bacteroidales bacterium]|nr:hypothetical protein [Bacteroidales bacterium]